MKLLTEFKTTTLLTIYVLHSFALSPRAEAVSPPPDGGYPGGNTAEGQNALLNVSTGTYNTAIGLLSLEVLATGQFCTGIGAGHCFLTRPMKTPQPALEHF